MQLVSSVADPGSGVLLTPGSDVLLTPGSGIRDGEWVQNQDPDPGPDHISESLETIFWIKILKFFDEDSGSRMDKIRIRDGKKIGSGINILDPQQCWSEEFYGRKKAIP
jgi:hypothetical protein